MVGLDGSGNTRKCSPLFKLYSVMPSAEVTFCTPLGRPWAGHSTGARKTAVTRKKLSILFCGFIFLSYRNSTSALRFAHGTKFPNFGPPFRYTAREKKGPPAQFRMVEFFQVLLL